ncbi:DNA repair protein RecN [Jeotgalibaca dankookensis]|uniref:DNA repair protein RecN n=1 Tax=Jeotgalibaca dankookensis TaxID=708126 RepID=A0A1S6IP41_9LACT|nr:DNA repair protein RecN [Jeotgalibaca dankookensis]AQS53296.1 DNA repair protein RecN [Jeotgalibaca dankookensis]
MLQELSIKNFAIIDTLQISFEQGMTVLTGETGAGKSIIIDAVGLLAGGRGSADFIRHGEDKTVIQGLFQMPESSQLASLMEEYGISYEPDQILLQRELSSSGKNVARVNGTIVTVSVLREIAAHLIDIHGQNEHQELMNPAKHLDLLDQFGDSELGRLIASYQDTYQIFIGVKQERDRLLLDEQQNIQRIDLLTFQISEIEGANLQNDAEEEALIEERNLLANYQRILQGLTTLYNALEGEDGNGLDQIGVGLGAIERIESLSPTYQDLTKRISEAYFQLQDVATTVRDEIDEMTYDEARLNEIEVRLELLKQLKRKYGSSIEEIKDYYEKISLELDMISNKESYLEKLATRYEAAEIDLYAKGRQLKTKRQKIAHNLETEIQEQLKALYMEKATFYVVFEEEEVIHPDGLNAVEFYIAPNVGEPPKPLAKIASGGELSRMMLAMKAIFTQNQEITSIIFDEVDTGVSGRVAQAIANKIHLVSEHSQVLCITHLPQVAAIADNHFYIEKDVVEERTFTHVFKIVGKKRTNEVARMLAGTEITELSLAHAEELLDLAKK